MGSLSPLDASQNADQFAQNGAHGSLNGVHGAPNGVKGALNGRRPRDPYPHPELLSDVNMI
eukprot:9090628-Heterocapsa_arctica.AAC.1